MFLMKKRSYLSALIALILLFCIATPIFAQDYSIAAPEVEVWVYLESDGTITIEYYYLFEVPPGAELLDFASIGMPADSSYSLGDISGTIDDFPFSGVSSSKYVDGVDLDFGANDIPSGGSGTMYMIAENVRNVFYSAASEDERDYASIEFMPNYFSSDLSKGSTEFTFTFVLPPGAQDGEVVWYTPKGWPGDETPASGFDDNGRLVYQWYTTDAAPDSRITFGVAFPAEYIPSDAIRTEQTATYNPSNLLGTLIPILCCSGVVGILVLVSVLAVKSAKKRKLKYLPPKIAIEGHGIKRGLTAVEAAILMEEPMDKILTMILFSVLRKDAAEVIKREPLDIKVEEKLPEGLREYETQFLEAFKGNAGAARRNALQNMMVALVKSIGEKMKGFSRKETIQYYKEIMEKAWQQVEGADTPEVRAEKYADAVDWTMLDKDYDQRTRRVFGSGPVFMPVWWWRADPTIGRTTTGGIGKTTSRTSSIPSAGRSKTVTLPKLPGSDAAASVVNTVSAFSAGVVGNVAAFTSGVTSKTNPVPKTTSSTFRSSGGKSGGGFSTGCACACACAGCACACAGGGR